MLDKVKQGPGQYARCGGAGLTSARACIATPLAPHLPHAGRQGQSAEHLTLIHPLWLGTKPAALKALLELHQTGAETLLGMVSQADEVAGRILSDRRAHESSILEWSLERGGDGTREPDAVSTTP